MLLFAYLMMHPQRHQRDEITDLLWADADSATGRRRLSHTLWQIRQGICVLSPAADPHLLITDRTTVGINPHAVALDTVRFGQSLRRASVLPSGSPQQIEALEQAVALHGDSGGFLSGYYDDWVLAERRRLLDDYLAALDKITQYYERMHQWETALQRAESALAADLFVEKSHQAVIRILAAMGNYVAARRRYQDLVRLFARGLDTEPSPATQALIRQLPGEQDKAMRTPTHPSEPLALPVSVPVPVPYFEIAPLPVPLTTFYGRENVLQELTHLFGGTETRLITLMGTGGIGKTRLALEFARGFAAHHALIGPAKDVAFIALADIQEPQRILEAIADAVSSNRALPPIPRIVHALAARALSREDHAPFLLILDNAEHLAEAVGGIITDLLTRIEGIRVLVTSQRSLGVSGEREIALASLEVPSPAAVPALVQQTASVQMFLNRAQLVCPDFPLTDASLADVARLCKCLEGLPLAIELCAGWAQTLTTKQMLEMLAHRFEFLVSLRSDIPARHRTLHATIEYSYLQLSGDLQNLFTQLSVFRDGWGFEAVREICGNGSISATLGTLAQLRERSLIFAKEAVSGDGMRYWMLESLRDFAAQQRTDPPENQLGEKHAAFFTRLIQFAVQRRNESDSPFWSLRVDEDLENIRRALEYLIDSGNVERTWTAGVAILDCWKDSRSLWEARRWLERMLAMDESQSDAPDLRRLRAKLTTIYADILSALGEFAESTKQAGYSLNLYQRLGDIQGTAVSKNLLGIVAILTNDFDGAHVLLTEALLLARSQSDTVLIARIINNLGRTAIALQDWPVAWELITEGLQLARQQNNGIVIRNCLNNLGLIARYQGDYQAAKSLFHEALKAYGQDKESSGNLALFVNLGTAERLDQQYEQSLSLLIKAARKTLLNGDRRVFTWSVKELGHLAVALQLYALGLQLLSAAETMRGILGISFKPLGEQEIAKDRQIAFNALGEISGKAHWAAGGVDATDSLIADAHTVIAQRLEQRRREIDKKLSSEGKKVE